MVYTLDILHSGHFLKSLNKIIMKSFENWLTQEVKQTFGLKKVKNHPDLVTWLNANHAPNAVQTAILKQLLDFLRFLRF